MSDGDKNVASTGPAFAVTCDSCRHKKHGDGGWCYMFREQPDVAKINQCAQHTGFQFGVSLLRRALDGAGKVIP